MDKNSLNNELRDILETEGALTDEQVARVDAIEADLSAMEADERSAAARAKAEERLNRPTFQTPAATGDLKSDYERFADWAIAGKEDRTLDTGNDGVLVPFDLQSELVKILNGVAGARQCVDVRTVGYDVEIARVASRPSITGFTGESADYGDQESTFDSVRSYAFKSTAITTITEELMQDSRPAVLAEVMEAQMASHGLFWDGQYLVDGVGGSNGPEAIFNSSQTGLNNTLTATSGEIALDDLLVAALEGLPAQYRGGNFSFLMHPTVESVLRREKDEAGRFQLMPQATGNDSTVPGSTIHGIPVVISTQAPTLDEAVAGSAPAVMMLEKSSYRIFDRMPLRTMRDEYTGASKGQVKFLSKMRSDGRWLAPWRSVAISIKP